MYGNELLKECMRCPMGCTDCESLAVCNACEKKYQFNTEGT